MFMIITPGYTAVQACIAIICNEEIHMYHNEKTLQIFQTQIEFILPYGGNIFYLIGK